LDQRFRLLLVSAGCNAKRETMAVVEVKNIQGEIVSEIDLSEEIFNVEVKQSVLHEVIKMQLANRRRGTAKVKRRSEVRGSTRKLFRQKGTGRARRGDIKSPLLRGGGVIFGPEPRDYSYKVPKKVRRLALKMALSAKYQGNEIIVLDGFAMDQIKTKAVASTLQRLSLEQPLIVLN
jgi:large subunit ribosomal protein L4